MEKAVIIYSFFLDEDGKEPTIGGIQTYILNLCKLLIAKKIEPVVIQPSKNGFSTEYCGIRVEGLPKNDGKVHISNRQNLLKRMYKRALEIVEPCNGLLIFGADQVSIKTSYPRAISIMHGIYWDLPVSYITTIGGKYSLMGKIPFFPQKLIKKIFTKEKLTLINNVNNVVCVDHNFINWYRTYIPNELKKNYTVIPNFVDIPKDHSPNTKRHITDKTIRILFARRFFEYRGTRIMVSAIKNLLKVTKRNIEVVFAGSGPDKDYIQNELGDFPGFTFTSYKSTESLKFHSSFHIAVVPSMASEGTSLSLAEAMASGCAVIASNVGGMSNMIIDNFNGKLIMPSIEELTDALIELVETDNLRKDLAETGFRTAQNGFSIDLWNAKWIKIIDSLREIKC